jgi:hypothetical protein
MPGFDGTGPVGSGPRTGGGFGFCPPGSGPFFSRGLYGAGRGGFPRGGGRGRAWGGGRGRRWADYPPPAPPAPYPAASGPASGDEAAFLREQAKGLQSELEAVRQRLEELERRKAGEQV